MFKVFLYLYVASFGLYINAQQAYHRTLSIEDGLPSNLVHSVFSDKRGFIWLGTPNGAVRWDSKNFITLRIEDGLPNNEVLNFFEDSRNRIWVGTFSSELCYIKDNVIYNRNKDKGLKRHKTCVGITVFEFDEKLFYYDTTTFYTKLDSLYFLKGEMSVIAGQFFIYNNKLITHNEYINDNLTYQLDYLKSIYYKDKINGVICTDRFPLNRKSIHQIIDSLIVPNYSIASTLKIKNDFRLYETPNLLFIFSPDMKIYPKNNKVQRFNSMNVSKFFFLNSRIYYLSEGSIYNLNSQKIRKLPTNSGNLYNIDKIKNQDYVITFNHEVYWLNQNLQLNRVKIDKKYYNIKHAFFDKKSNRYYIGTGTNLLQFDNERTKALINFKTYCSYIDKNQTLWYSGLSQIFYTNNFESKITHEKELILNTTSPPFVKQIQEDQYGNIIFTTNNGIYIHDKVTRANYHLSSNNLLSTNECQNLVLDPKNQFLWIATPSGLNQIYYQKVNHTMKFNLINRFFKCDGLPSDEVNDVLVSGDSVWVATSKGLSLISGIKKIPDTFKVPIYINSIKLNDSLISIKNNYDLASNQNNILIDYSAIYFQRRDRLAIYYTLIRNGDTLRKGVKDNAISLVSLESGDYELQILAYDIDYPYIYGSSEKILFSIKPPYYQTWWFWGLITICLVLIISSIIYLFYNRKKDKLEFINSKMELEKDLAKFKLEALKAEMNPHFIFNCLNSIKDFILRNESEKSQYYLSRLSQLIRIALYNSKEDFISLQNELEFIDIYVELEQLRFNQGFEFIKDIKNPDLLNAEIPTMMLQPFIENAIRHGKIGQLDKKGKLSLTVFEENHFIVFQVKDNGIGLTESEKVKQNSSTEHKSMAMNIIKDRISVYNATYELNMHLKISELTAGEYSTLVEFKYLLD